MKNWSYPLIGAIASMYLAFTGFQMITGGSGCGESCSFGNMVAATLTGGGCSAKEAGSVQLASNSGCSHAAKTGVLAVKSGCGSSSKAVMAKSGCASKDKALVAKKSCSKPCYKAEPALLAVANDMAPAKKSCSKPCGAKSVKMASGCSAKPAYVAKEGKSCNPADCMMKANPVLMTVANDMAPAKKACAAKKAGCDGMKDADTEDSEDGTITASLN